MSEHPAGQKVRTHLRTAISSAVARLLTSTKQVLSISRQATVLGTDSPVSAVRFARSLQRAARVVDDASVPRTGDPQEWLERSLAHDQAARRGARTQQRLMEERTLKSVDFAAKDIAMRRAVSEVDFPR